MNNGLRHRSLRCDAWNWCERSRRVTILMVGVILLSLADLLITLAFLRAHWMMEANPIAAWLIKSTQCAWVLAAFKACTVGVCVALLYRARHYVIGEVAAWCAVGILSVMAVMWHHYTAHFDDPHELVLTSAAVCDDSRLGLP